MRVNREGLSQDTSWRQLPWQVGKIGLAALAASLALYSNPDRKIDLNQNQEQTSPNFNPSLPSGIKVTKSEINQQDSDLSWAIRHGFPMIFIAGSLTCQGSVSLNIENPVIDRTTNGGFLEGYVVSGNDGPIVNLINPYNPSVSVPGLRYCVLKNSNDKALDTATLYQADLTLSLNGNYMSGIDILNETQHLVSSDPPIPVGRKIN